MRLYDDTGPKMRCSLLLLVVSIGMAMAYPAVNDVEYPFTEGLDVQKLNKAVELLILFKVSADDVLDIIATEKAHQMKPYVMRDLGYIVHKLQAAESGKYVPDMNSLMQDEVPHLVRIDRGRREAKDDSSSSEDSNSSETTNNENNNINKI